MLILPSLPAKSCSRDFT